LRGFSLNRSQVAAEIVSFPNGEPPGGGSKNALDDELLLLAVRERQRDGRAEAELVRLRVVLVSERPVVAER